MTGKMSKYNEQHATTMLNALIGTDTLANHNKRLRKEIIDEFINECCKYEDLTFDKEHIKRIKIIAEQLKKREDL